MSIASVKTWHIAWAPSLKHRSHLISDLHSRSRSVFSRDRGSSNFKRLPVFCMDVVQMDSMGVKLSKIRSAYPSYPAIFFLSQYLDPGYGAVFFSFHRSNPWRMYSGLNPKVSQIFLKEKIQ